MKLFKMMSNREHMHWRKGAVLGFYTYMFLLFINYSFFLIDGSEPLSSKLIFWAGLLVAFGYEGFLNIKLKVKGKRTNSQQNL
ncbi:hypothetical protein [Cytobacillus gottheilii]|uniref:hypothetical protein n=1 Tax=Cytobacillus gottheilii TaxID=859144 RepID=UPI0009B9BF2F|nr:hypothetical protein [Cytobacillus gottheilii]